MQKRIPLALIYGNPDQPRRTFDESTLRELATSIRENGLKQPITVRADDDGRYMIVMGERRFRAHQILNGQDADRWPDVLCQISKADDKQLAIDAIIENDQRVDVAPLEQARAYQRMIDHHGFTLDTLAIKLGKPIRRINERLVLLNLTDDCQKLLAGEQITPTQAWALAHLQPREQGLLLKAINAGQCRTTEQLNAVAETLKSDAAQDALFAMPDPVTDDERRRAATFEQTVDKLMATLRSAIDDNQTVTAVRRVDPNKASMLADLFAAMSVDVRRIETAFRVAAAGNAMVQE